MTKNFSNNLNNQEVTTNATTFSPSQNKLIKTSPSKSSIPFSGVSQSTATHIQNSG